MLKKRTPRDYKFIRLLGEGSFSSVYLAVDADIDQAILKTTSGGTSQATTPNNRTKPRKYAIKVCQKSHIKRQGKQVAIMREKEIMNILNQCSCKHFIRLYCTFQDAERLFFVMSYAEKGELLTYMLANPLSLIWVRRFTSQLVEALENLHKLDIVHRDLKPENILLSDQMDILISDFGSAQIYKPSPPSQTADETVGARRNSFVGTAQYVSPEMLKDRQASNKSDLWALGVIVFQMITNVMPFDAPNEYLIYKKIQSLDYKFPDNFDPSARELVTSLIKLEPLERLGARDDFKQYGYKSIRQHSFLCALETGAEAVDQCSNPTSDGDETKLSSHDLDFVNIDRIIPGLDETQLLRLLTDG